MVQPPTIVIVRVILLEKGDTVDGRNPATVEVGSSPHSSPGFIHSRWLFGISSINTNPLGKNCGISMASLVGEIRFLHLFVLIDRSLGGSL